MSIGEPVVSVVDAGGNGDFSTLTTWESTQQRNLVTADEQELCKITASGSLAGGLQIAGWTTDQNHKITMMPHGSEAYHEGIANRRQASINGGTWGIYINDVHNVTVQDMHVGSGSTYGIILRASGCIIDRCIVDGDAGAANWGIYAFSTNWGNNPSFVQNTVVHGALTGVYVNNSSSTNVIRLPVINCTIDARGTGNIALRGNGAGARIFSENNMLEANTIYSTSSSAAIFHGRRDSTSNTEAFEAALRNIRMGSAVVNPDDGLNAKPYDYHLQTTPGPTLASGLAGSGLYPAGSGIALDFELDERTALAGARSIGADERNIFGFEQPPGALFSA